MIIYKLEEIENWSKFLRCHLIREDKHTRGRWRNRKQLTADVRLEMKNSSGKHDRDFRGLSLRYDINSL